MTSRKKKNRSRRRRMIGLAILLGLALACVAYNLVAIGIIRCDARRIERGVDNVIVGAEPFSYAGGRTGCLLIHGFPGNPAEMKELGRFLAERGITVRGVRLPGFGTTPSDLRKRKWEEWVGAGEEGFAVLQRACDRIFLVGFSTGGLVALHLAAHNDVAGVASLSTFIFPKNRLARIAEIPIAKQIVPACVRYTPTLGGLATASHGGTNANDLAYRWIPLSAGVQIMEFANETRRLLGEIDAPLLILQARDDSIVSPESVRYMEEHAGSGQKKVVWVDVGGHVVTMSASKTAVFEEISAFLAAVAANEHGMSNNDLQLTE